MPKSGRNPLDNDVDYMVDSMVRQVESAPDDSIPFASTKLSRDEQITRYMELRDNPQKWVEVLDAQGLTETIKYAQHMEKMLHADIE